MNDNQTIRRKQLAVRSAQEISRSLRCSHSRYRLIWPCRDEKVCTYRAVKLPIRPSWKSGLSSIGWITHSGMHSGADRKRSGGTAPDWPADRTECRYGNWNCKAVAADKFTSAAARWKPVRCSTRENRLSRSGWSDYGQEISGYLI